MAQAESTNLVGRDLDLVLLALATHTPLLGVGALDLDHRAPMLTPPPGLVADLRERPLPVLVHLVPDGNPVGSPNHDLGTELGYGPSVSTLNIEPVPCLSDNYAYLITNDQDQVWIVDPSEAEPVQRHLSERNLQLQGILATHHHPDHVDGIKQLQLDNQVSGSNPCWVAGHASDKGRIPCQSHFIDAPLETFVTTEITVAGRPVQAMHIPGHTTGAIAWKIDDDVFTGDTLFSAGCGRLFEGTAEQMYASLQSIVRLDANTRLWFGHEYTASNLRFASSEEPKNTQIAELLKQNRKCTTPTTVAQERAINPFVRAKDGQDLAEIRHRKDKFKG